MNVIKYLFHLILMMLFFSCHTPEEKLNILLNSEELLIKQNVYGGIGGQTQHIFHLKKGEFNESLLLIHPGTNYQTFVEMDEKKDLLKQFINKAFETHIPNRPMSHSCMAIDCEYILKSGFTSLKLRPDTKCDSLFNLILKQ